MSGVTAMSMSAEVMDHAQDRRGRRRRRSLLAFDAREIFLFVALDLVGCEELGVVVFDCETEMGAVVGLDNLHVVAAKFGGGTFHSSGSVVISGDRQRPASQRLVVILQQLGGGLGRAHRVQTVVAITCNLEKLAPGRAGELPNSQRAGG